MTTYTDDPAPWHHLACRLLLDGALGAHAGNPGDVEWVNSDDARKLADLVGLPRWPPPRMIGRRELQARARDLNPADGPVGALDIRSRNPADENTASQRAPLVPSKRKPSPWRRGPAVVDAQWLCMGMN